MGSPARLKTPSLLRQQAEYCRRLAAGFTNNNVRRRLLALATELDKQAATLKPEEVCAATTAAAVIDLRGVDHRPAIVVNYSGHLWSVVL
jgi:hypothetical protein